jgi:hypothetical protein
MYLMPASTVDLDRMSRNVSTSAGIIYSGRRGGKYRTERPKRTNGGPSPRLRALASHERLTFAAFAYSFGVSNSAGAGGPAWADVFDGCEGMAISSSTRLPLGQARQQPLN